MKLKSEASKGDARRLRGYPWGPVGSELKGSTAEESTAAIPRRGKTRRRLAWGALLVVLGLLLGYGLRDRWLVPRLKTWCEDYARQALGAELSIGEHSGSWFADLQLEGVQWQAPEGPLLALKDARLAASYSLLSFLRGPARISKLELSAEGLELDLSPGEESASEDGASLELPVVEFLVLDLKAVRLLGLGAQSVLSLDSLYLEGSLVEGVLQLARCELRRGSDHLRVSELRVDLQGDSLEAWLLDLAAQWSLELKHPEELWDGGLLPPGLRLDWSGQVAAGQLELGGELSLQGGGLRIERGGLKLPTGELLGDWWQAIAVDLDLAADFEDLSGFGPLAGVELQGALEGQLRLRGTLADPLGMLRGEIKNLRVAEARAQLLQVDVEARQGRVLVRSFGVKDEALQAQFKGVVGIEPLSFEACSLVLKAPDLAKLWPGLPEVQNLLLEVELAGSLEEPRGTYRLNTSAAPSLGVDLQALEMSGSFGATEVSFDQLHADLAQASLEARGALRLLNPEEQKELGVPSNHFELALEELTAKAGDVSCSLGQPHRSILGAERLSISGMQWVTAGGKALLDLQRDAEGLRADFRVDAFDPQPLLAPWFPGGMEPGILNGNLSFQWPAGDGVEPQLQAELKGSRVQAFEGGPGWIWELQANYDNALLSVPAFQARSSDGALWSMRLQAPIAAGASDWMGPGELELNLVAEELELSQAVAEYFPAAAGLEGLLNSTLDMSGTWEALQLNLVGGVQGLQTPAQWLDFGGRKHQLSFDIASGAKQQRLTLELKGNVQLSTQGALDWDGNARELLRDLTRWRDMGLEATARMALPDLAWLAKLSPATRGAEGSFEADLRLAGPLGKLDPSGSLALHKGALRIGAGLPTLRELELIVDFDPDYQLSLKGTGELGGAPFEVGGKVTETASVNPILDLVLKGDNLLLVRNSELRLRAGVDLSLKGPLEELLIGGQVELKDGRFARNMDILNGLLNRSRSEASTSSGIGFSLAHEGPLASAKFDVALRSSNAFRVDSNLAQIYLRPELQLTGTGEVPIFTGSVYLAPSNIKLPSGRLNIRSGQLEFLPGDPFEPRLNVQADMNAQGYRVQVVFEGTLNQPEILLSSQPPLASDELMLLFLTGRKPSGTSDQALQSVAIYLANDFLTSWLFEKDADAAESMAERFHYEVGASLSESGAPTGRATFLLHSQRDGPGRSHYLVTDLDQYDHLNYGYGILFRFR